MSEQQNTALVQSLYAAFAKGDVQTILDNLTSDVEWTLEGPSILPFAGKRHGVAEVKKFFEALAGTQTNMKLTPQQFVAQGEMVAIIGRYSATVTATGKGFDGPLAHFFTIRAGKVVRFIDVADTAAMVDAYQSASAAGR